MISNNMTRIILTLVIILLIMPQVQASTIQAGEAITDVNASGAMSTVALTGFTWLNPSGPWQLTWDASDDPTIELNISIIAENFLDVNEELEWRSLVNISLTWHNPNPPYNDVVYDNYWTTSGYPSNIEWDHDSEDIDTYLECDEGGLFPAAFAGNTWDWEIELHNWWMNGEDEEESSDSIVGYIVVVP